MPDSDPILVAAVQLASDDDPEASFARAAALVARAAARGARVVALPENLLEETTDPARVHDLALWAPRLAALARDSRVALVAGTVREPSPAGRPYQASLVFDSTGAELFRYRKLHLFDATPPGGAAERESAHLAAGPADGLRPFDLPPLGPCGLGICYDLRFPGLWRRLALAGARTLFAPSSFALGTGKDHWHVLLRVRAIESQAYVVAPAQAGTTRRGRARYGHAAIVDPWGSVLADAGGEGEGLALAEVDPAFQESVRARLPSLEHARLSGL